MVRIVVKEDTLSTYKPRVAIVDDVSNASTQRVVDLIKKAGGKPMVIPRHLSDRLLASQNLDATAIARIHNAESADDVRDLEGAIVAATKLHLEYIARKLTYVDAVVLPGSEFDIPPEAYHETNVHAQTRLAPPLDVRFQTELLMADYALHTKKVPLLGIGHGMQMLVVKTGGRLIQHLPDYDNVAAQEMLGGTAQIKAGSPVTFRSAQAVSMAESKSILGSILRGKQAEAVLTQDFSGEAIGLRHYQHQAVRVEDVNARELIVTATRDERLVEAVEHRHHPFCVGVQFHPEHDVKNNLGMEMIQSMIDFARTLHLPLKKSESRVETKLPHFTSWFDTKSAERALHV